MSNEELVGLYNTRISSRLREIMEVLEISKEDLAQKLREMNEKLMASAVPFYLSGKHRFEIGEVIILGRVLNVHPSIFLESKKEEKL